MFQSFEIATNPDNAKPRVSALREEMKKLGLDGYLVPRADEHQGEYVPPHAQRLQWLTGFTGSAGVALILKDKAVIFPCLLLFFGQKAGHLYLSTSANLEKTKRNILPVMSTFSNLPH